MSYTSLLLVTTLSYGQRYVGKRLLQMPFSNKIGRKLRCKQWQSQKLKQHLWDAVPRSSAVFNSLGKVSLSSNEK